MKMPEIMSGWNWNEPSPVNHHDFHEHVVEMAVKMFNNKPIEETMIGIFVLAGTGQTTVLHTPWEGEAEKYAVSRAMRHLLAKAGPIIEAYAFITEAWVAVGDKRDEHGDYIQPSQRDDSEDVLMIFTTMKDGTTKSTRFAVKSYPPPLPMLPTNRKPRLLERDDVDYGEGAAMTGMMFNFFKSEKEAMANADAVIKQHRQKGQDND